MQMARHEIKIKHGTIIIEATTPDIHLLSFNTCFEIVSEITLPHPFIHRGRMVFCPITLLRPSSILESIACEGTIGFHDLKKYLPSLFDMAFIKSHNSMIIKEQSKARILALVEEVITGDEIEKLKAEGTL
ncbi:hypothetical protein ENBRE01_0006 [Enteropsectra breve]|nr:hypothetical protein ENBRE01_0006 [Enteropsectra breve]